MTRTIEVYELFKQNKGKVYTAREVSDILPHLNRTGVNHSLYQLRRSKFINYKIIKKEGTRFAVYHYWY